MKKSARFIAAGTTVLIMLTMGIGHAAHSESATYVGGSFATGVCQTSTRPGIAETCFTPRAGETRATINAVDATGPAPYFWLFSDASGNCAGGSSDPTNTDACPGSGLACGRVNATIPAGSVKLEVFLDDAATGVVECQVFDPNESAIGVNTTGTVTVSFV